MSRLKIFSKFLHLKQALKPRQSFRDYHCVKSVSIRSFSVPCFSAFGLNTESYSVSFRIQSEYGKIRTRKTPITDFFTQCIIHTSDSHSSEIPRVCCILFRRKIALPWKSSSHLIGIPPGVNLYLSNEANSKF